MLTGTCRRPPAPARPAGKAVGASHGGSITGGHGATPGRPAQTPKRAGSSEVLGQSPGWGDQLPKMSTSQEWDRPTNAPITGSAPRPRAPLLLGTPARPRSRGPAGPGCPAESGKSQARAQPRVAERGRSSSTRQPPGLPLEPSGGCGAMAPPPGSLRGSHQPVASAAAAEHMTQHRPSCPGPTARTVRRWRRRQRCPAEW